MVFDHEQKLPNRPKSPIIKKTVVDRDEMFNSKYDEYEIPARLMKQNSPNNVGSPIGNISKITTLNQAAL